MANFRAPYQPGHGMSRGGRGDREVWDEFSGDPDALRRTADAIRAGYSSPQATAGVAVEEDEEEAHFPEGRVIYRLHRARERNRALVKRKKAQALNAHGRLACEARKFDFAAQYGTVGDGYIECHHTLPLADVAGSTITRLEDVVLLCSNCHRMVHRKRPWLTPAAIHRLVNGDIDSVMR